MSSLLLDTISKVNVYPVKGCNHECVSCDKPAEYYVEGSFHGPWLTVVEEHEPFPWELNLDMLPDITDSNTTD